MAATQYIFDVGWIDIWASNEFFAKLNTSHSARPTSNVSVLLGGGRREAEIWKCQSFDEWQLQENQSFFVFWHHEWAEKPWLVCFLLVWNSQTFWFPLISTLLLSSLSPFFKINLIKTSQIKTVSVQDISRSIHYGFLSWQESAWRGSSAIMYLPSKSLLDQWPIHQTFIFCPLSTVSLCLSLPSLGCCER